MSAAVEERNAAAGKARGLGVRDAGVELASGEPMWFGSALDEASAREYRMRAVFECGKLDPQVADTPVLAPFPLVVSRRAWEELAGLAEALSAEAIAAEREIAGRRKLHRHLSLPSAVRRALNRTGAAAVDSGVRLSRLDFHWASDDAAMANRSWRVSEVNADVPGGFIEAGPLARLMVEMGREGSCEAEAGPDPGDALAVAIARQLEALGNGEGKGEVGGRGVVALVHATAYADDFQVMRRVQECLTGAGLRSVLSAPDHVEWRGGVLGGGAVHTPSGERVGAIVRFFPAEWMPELGRRRKWESYFGESGGAASPTASGASAADATVGDANSVLLTNPATALLVQSKRWALLWDRLETRVETWRRLMPETVDPRVARRRSRALPRSAFVGDQWVLKPAMGRVGEGVLVPGVASKDEKAVRRGARRDPRGWVAQRRFFSVPIQSPIGPLHVCLGVYVVDGRAAGMYARASSRALIDQGAFEVPVLIERGGRQVREDERGWEGSR